MGNIIKTKKNINFNLQIMPENITPKQNTYNISNLEKCNNILVITLNSNNLIININKNHKDLFYLKDDLIYKPLNYILTNIYNIILKDITILDENQKIILLDKNNNPHYYSIDLVYYNKNNKIIILNKIFETINYNLYSYNNKTKDFIITKNNIIIICIDFINSTELLNNIGPINTINIHKKYYNIIIKLINTKYLNYIFIHEIIGDSFILVMNHDNNFNIKDHCCSICLYFLYELIKLTEEFIGSRIGITYDTAYCGYINNNFRIFGKGINLASRLQNNSSHNSILFCNNFYNKIKNEEIYNNLIINKKILSLKGFDTNTYYSINFDQNIILHKIFINRKN